MRILFIITVLIFSLNAKSILSNTDQADDSKYLGALKDLVIATQKTRGLTNNYLCGNSAALILVFDNRRDMQTALNNLNSLPLSSNPAINNKASDISQALIKINDNAIKYKDTKNNTLLVFEQYTELISQTLTLAQTVKEYTSKNCSPLGKDLSTIMTEVILPLSEYVGQMRGMGAGIITKGEITKEQEKKMLLLITKIESLTSKLIADTKLIASNNKESFDSNLNSKLVSLKKSGRDYTSLTITEVLSKRKSTLDSDIYFDNGSNLISILIDIYNINNKAILNDSKGWI